MRDEPNAAENPDTISTLSVDPTQKVATDEIKTPPQGDSELPPALEIDISKYEKLLIVSIEQLKEGTQSSVAAIQNFEIRHANKEIGVPSNYDKLIEQSYLYLLILAVCKSEGYKLIATGKVHQPRFVTNKAIEATLKGFGLPLISKVIPKCPDLKGYSKDGIMSCVNHIIQGKKGVRGDLFKCHSARHIAQIVLGSVWAKDSPVEKNILDSLISYARKNVSDRNIHTYLVSMEQLKNIYGIKLNLHKSDLFTTQEQKLLDLYLETIELNDLKYDDNDDITSVSAHVNTSFNELQKKLKDYKTFTQSVISKRLEACFEPYPKGKKRDQARKTPIKQHLANVRSNNPLVLVPTELIRGVLGVSIRPPSYKESYEDIQKWYEDALSSIPSEKRSWAESPTVSQTIITIWDEYGNDYQLWDSQE